MCKLWVGRKQEQKLRRADKDWQPSPAQCSLAIDPRECKPSRLDAISKEQDWSDPFREAILKKKSQNCGLFPYLP